MQRAVLVLVLAGTLFSACRTIQEQAADTKSVFGVDDRVAAPDWLPIGYLDGGTAFAVGPRTIMTAAHVVASLPKTGIKFEMADGKTFDVTEIVAVGVRVPAGTYPPGTSENDWAILRVDKTLPDFLTLQPVQTQGEKIMLAGFSMDFSNATIDPDCKTRHLAGGTLYHDCAIAPGASGGPVLAQRTGKDGKPVVYVIGIQSSEKCNNPNGTCSYPEGWTLKRSNTANRITNALVELVKKENARD